MTLRLLLARHGRTAANATHVLDSRLPGSALDDHGRAQAELLARRLATWPIRAVHASRATRAQQTAAPVAAALGFPVGVVDGVHEVDLGDMEGRNDEAALETFAEVYAGWWRGDLDARMPGGESAAEVRARFLPALAGLVDGATGGDVLLVSHGAAVRLAAAALLGETAETFYVPNAGVVVLRREGDGWALEGWDDAEPVPGDVTAGGAPE